MNEAVARRLREIAAQVQAEHPVSAIDRAGMLAPLTLFLAEFHYLGYTRKVMHEFAKRAGVEISYQRLCVWVLNQFGDQPKEAIGEAVANSGRSRRVRVTIFSKATKARKARLSGRGGQGGQEVQPWLGHPGPRVSRARNFPRTIAADANGRSGDSRGTRRSFAPAKL